MNRLAVAPDAVRTSFRQAMGNVAAAVSVVTVLERGVPHGTTVSAFSSLSTRTWAAWNSGCAWKEAVSWS